MNVQLEKLFFKYVITNRKYYEVVEPDFFKTNEYRFCYTVLREYMNENPDCDYPSSKQYYTMIKSADLDDRITPNIFKSIFGLDLSEYDELAYILPNLNAWILSNRLDRGIVESIDVLRKMKDEGSNLKTVIEKGELIQEIIKSSSKTNFMEDENDYGSDFDDVESHYQDTSNTKIKSGYNCLDSVLSGGFDEGTLNVLMAETNGGKSLWMQNLAVKASNLGKNVLYITLEMTEKKVMKRLGAMRLNIPINDYDNVSKDREYMERKISEMHTKDSGGLFQTNRGKIITKFWATGTTTIQEFDNFIERVERKMNIKIDFIIVDYIALIALPKNQQSDNLYLKGKYLAEGLRAMASKHKCPLVTGVQVAKGAWNSMDITLEDIPESKAIAETADTFFAIIRTEEMKKRNLYHLKLLKQRDGDFSRRRIEFDLNPIHLTIVNDRFLEETPV